MYRESHRRQGQTALLCGTSRPWRGNRHPQREGEPVARLVGMEPERKRRPVGLGAGRFHIPPDFDTLASAEILRLFEGPAE